MDGEQILLYASLLNMIGIAAVSVLTWMNRSGRDGGKRDAMLESMHKSISRLNELVNTLPTRESMKLLDAQMRVEVRDTEARLLKTASDLAATLAQVTASTAVALAQTTAAAAAAAAAARGDPR